MSFKELTNYPGFKVKRQQIYEEALSRAIAESKSGFKLEPQIIEFRVHYVTNVSSRVDWLKFGQEVCMIGSINRMGSWDAENRAVKMKWNNGHLWSMQFEVKQLEPLFEYKFVIKEGKQLVRWEEGHNHIYDYNKLLQRMKQPEIIKQISEGKYDEIEVATEKDKIGYNKKTKVFFVHTLWQAL